MKKKSIFFIMIPVVFIVTIILSVLVYSSISSSFASDEDEPDYEQIANAEHDVLLKVESYYDEELGSYIQIAKMSEAEEYIAFAMDEGSDIIDYGAGSYYPECYWEGDYTEENLSESVFLNHKYRENATEETAAYIRDISEIEDEKYYYSYGDRSSGYMKGIYVKEKYAYCSNVRVYDITSYIGSIQSDFHKEQAKILGKGVGLILAAGICVIGLIVCIILLILGIVIR